jgi:hypothetical protein
MKQRWRRILAAASLVLLLAGATTGAIRFSGSGGRPLQQISGPIDPKDHPITAPHHAVACPNQQPCGPDNLPVPSPSE